MKKVTGRHAAGNPGDGAQMQVKARSYEVLMEGYCQKVRTALEDGDLRRLPVIVFHGTSARDAAFLQTPGFFEANFVVVNPHAQNAPSEVGPFLVRLFDGLDICLDFASKGALKDFASRDYKGIGEMDFPMVLVAHYPIPHAPLGGEMARWQALGREMVRWQDLSVGMNQVISALKPVQSEMENAIRKVNSSVPEGGPAWQFGRVSKLKREFARFFARKIPKMLEALSACEYDD